MVARGFGTAAVLMILVLVLFGAARVIGGHGAGRLTERQRRAAQGTSARMAQRIDGYHNPAAPRRRMLSRPKESS
jgi:phosphate transport system permease protein